MAERPHRNIDGFIDEVRASQRNIVFPDTVRNARSADLFLWRGSPRPSRVQRIAAWMIGLQFIGLGLAVFSRITKDWDEGSLFGLWMTTIIGGGSILIGINIFRNGFPRPKA